MEYAIRRGSVFQNGGFSAMDLEISGGGIVPGGTVSPDCPTLDASSLVIFPGFADVHVHLREPGFLYKETIRTGTLAAARGGFTAVCAMPNLDPVPDCPEALRVQLDAIRRDARVRVVPYGTITRGERGERLSDMEALAPFVAGFSDDGKGVQSEGMMRGAMAEAKRLGKIIAAHCEDNSLLRGGWIHDGAYAAAHGHRGICSESEWRQVARDLELVRQTGCAYHVCHVSTKESVALIRKAKSEGLDVTCETAPHYLLLDDDMLQEDGRFKMNPPVRSAEDRAALLEGILDGTVDMIATDHAPHAPEEKSRGLEKSLMGVVGLETAFPVLYTGLVLTGLCPLSRLLELLVSAPRGRFALGGGRLLPGNAADLSVWDLGAEYEIDPAEFLSKGRSTPFEGMRVRGRCVCTFSGGRVVWSDGTRLPAIQA